MKKISFLFLIALVYSFANENIAIVKFAQGDVHVKNSKGLVDIKIGHQLQEKDVIVTGKNSEVGVAFKDGSTLTLGANSYIVVENFVFNPLEKKFNFNLNLKKGRTVFESGKIGKLSPKSFHMKVPQGVIGIRGTKFLVDVE